MTESKKKMKNFIKRLLLLFYGFIIGIFWMHITDKYILNGLPKEFLYYFSIVWLTIALTFLTAVILLGIVGLIKWLFTGNCNF